MTRRTHLTYLALLLVAAPLAFAIVGATKPPADKGATAAASTALPGPRPDYAPDQVVQIVTEALKNNDEADEGIAVTFNFASPGNQKMTGPLERFVGLVKSPAYRPLLNCEAVECGEVGVDEGGVQAAQVVTVTTPEGRVVSYLFQLSKQADGKFKGCWMTDGVVPVKPRQKVADRERPVVEPSGA